YFNDGVETVYCEDCKTTVSETPVSAIKTAPVIFDDAVLDPETNKLTVAWTYSEALNEDIKAAATKGLAVKFAFGDKEYTVPNTVLNTEGGSVTIEGINADRFNEELTVKLEFAIGDYNTEVLNGAAIYTVAVNTTVSNENQAKADAYTGLINAIANATEAVVEGAGTGSADFTAEDSSVDIKAGTATFKFVATQEFFNTVKANGTDNRTVKLVVTVDGEEHEVTINQLKTSIKVTIKGLSFEQMYGSVSAKLVITYSDDSSKNIDSKAVSFNFADGIDASENTVAVALEALLKN
ncbi:MAG: hypothetical protein J6B80_06725, partial [Clostridia bacterium]|nr:hypothetical protein [Clostridia bacterium]